MDQPDGEIVVANLREKRANLRVGAKVMLLWMPGDCGRALVSGVSTGGRRIQTWITTSVLTNARIRRVPAGVNTAFWGGYHGRPAELVCRIINGETEHASRT